MFAYVIMLALCKLLLETFDFLLVVFYLLYVYLLKIGILDPVDLYLVLLVDLGRDRWCISDSLPKSLVCLF